MNKMIIGLSVIIVAAFGWLAFQSSSAEYVSTIDDQVTQLEADLVKVEADVQAGNLSADQATVVRANLAARLESINVAVEASESKNLSTKQQAALVDGLARLKTILVKYQSTITVVENTASVKPPLASTKGNFRNSLAAILTETIVAVESNAIEVVDDYTPADTEPEEVTDDNENMSDDSTSEETMDDTDDTTSTSTEETSTSTEESTDPESEADSSTEVEAEPQTETATDTTSEASVEAGVEITPEN